MIWRKVLVLVWLLQGIAAAAGDRCQAGSKDTWLSKTELERRLVAQGWKLRRIKVDDGCYEVYGWDPGGKAVEVHFHPRTLEPVARRADD